MTGGREEEKRRKKEKMAFALGEEGQKEVEGWKDLGLGRHYCIIMPSYYYYW